MIPLKPLLDQRYQAKKISPIKIGHKSVQWFLSYDVNILIYKAGVWVPKNRECVHAVWTVSAHLSALIFAKQRYEYRCKSERLLMNTNQNLPC